MTTHLIKKIVADKPLETAKYMTMEIKKGILVVEYSDVHITLEVARDIVRSRLKYQKCDMIPALAHGKSILSANKEARDYFATEGNEGMSALAIIMESAFSCVLGNFYLKVSKPNIPTRLFSNEEQATKWLQQFIFS